MPPWPNEVMVTMGPFPQWLCDMVAGVIWLQSEVEVLAHQLLGWTEVWMYRCMAVSIIYHVNYHRKGMTNVKETHWLTPLGLLFGIIKRKNIWLNIYIHVVLEVKFSFKLCIVLLLVNKCFSAQICFLFLSVQSILNLSMYFYSQSIQELLVSESWKQTFNFDKTHEWSSYVKDINQVESLCVWKLACSLKGW